jgi:hypothetical protein
VKHARTCLVTIQAQDGATARYTTDCEQLGRRF